MAHAIKIYETTPSIPVSFFTPIYDSRRPFFSAIEGYFDWAGHGACTVRHRNHDKQQIEGMKKELPWWNVALKVVSCATLVIPLVALLLKVIYRSRSSYVWVVDLAESSQYQKLVVGGAVSTRIV
ncbi:MAG: hypothetical protein KGJ02_00920 [Verrucomicrobiota bacterium]|nr:hypothetical protein [Verrucomicrobiota bacterium]